MSSQNKNEGELLKNKKVTVMGIGLHGGAVDNIIWLLKNGAIVTATDLKSAKELTSSVKKLKSLSAADRLRLVLGEHRKEDFVGADLVLKNPNVRWDNEFIKAAQEANVAVEMDSSLFFKYCPSQKIIGVTGTKGKTTTSLLIAHLLVANGKKVVKVGTDTEPVLGKLNEISQDDWVVFELSSWRLSALGKSKISPNFSLITNIFPDHLNYYHSMEEYVADKEFIFQFQDENGTVIFNDDSEYGRDFYQKSKGKRLVFSLKEELSFEKEGVFLKEDFLWLKFNNRLEKIINVSEVNLPGKHNLANMAAAVLMAICSGIDPEKISAAIKNFSAVPHRLEKVMSFHGVDFYNDTAATMPEATIAAIDAFEDRNINLICGGSSKNLDLSDLAWKISFAKNVKRVLLLKGEGSVDLENRIKEYGEEGKIVAICESMAEAVRAANDFSSDREMVLLSPGCASFGMFKNEFDRGEQFVNEVKKMV